MSFVDWVLLLWLVAMVGIGLGVAFAGAGFFLLVRCYRWPAWRRRRDR